VARRDPKPQIWSHQILASAAARQGAPLPLVETPKTVPNPRLLLPDLPSATPGWYRRREGFGSAGALESFPFYCIEERDEASTLVELVKKRRNHFVRTCMQIGLFLEIKEQVCKTIRT
jgi:hypothetical protein